MNKTEFLIESETTNTLLTIGIPANLQGFQFLKDAIVEVLKCPSMLHQLTKKLYPEVGLKNNVGAAIVERSIRNAIETACKNNGTIYNLNDLLNSQYFNEGDKPCNGCLIALLAEHVKKTLYSYAATIESEGSAEKSALAKEIEETLEEGKNKTLA